MAGSAPPFTARPHRPLSAPSTVISSADATMGPDYENSHWQEDTATAPLLIKATNGKAQQELSRSISRCRSSWRTFLLSDVDPDHATGPLAAFCFMTGFIDAISFTAAFVWCGFQTGNFAQLALAVARISTTQDADQRVLLPADLLALTSLLAFNLGAFAGGRIGDRIGARTRGWLAGATLAQAVLTLLAGACVHTSGEESISVGRGVPAWNSVWSSVAMGLMAASLGIQGVIGKRLGTNFSTTVVLTALWVELVADAQLFKSPTRRIASRDHRVLALGALFGGALLARVALIRFGAVGTLGLAAGVRLGIALWWLIVQGKRESSHVIADDAQVANYGTLA